MTEEQSTQLARRTFLGGAALVPLGAALTACSATEASTTPTAGSSAEQSHPGETPRFFEGDFHDRFGRWPAGYIPYGGADIGDIAAVAAAVGTGDDSVFYDAFVAAGDAKAAQAHAAEAAGLTSSARDLYMRASCMYSAAYHPLYGTPVDPRLLAAFDTQMEAFRRSMALRPVPVQPTTIPFENRALPAYFVPATGRESEVRPLLILNNGYDATITDLYLASGAAAVARGYHVLMFDGPGQGAMLYKEGVPLRADWEVVINAVVDFAQGIPTVDKARIALSGWSLGGYLAPRAATGEPRLAACVADPGQWDLGATLVGFMKSLGATDAQAAGSTPLDAATEDRMMKKIDADRILRWTIVQRGFWANGVTNLQDFFAKSRTFTLKDKVGDIHCPTLLTSAENDPLAASTKEFYDALTCPKKLLPFTAKEGAGDHTEMGNRSLLNLRVLDWLDQTLV